MSHTIDRTPNIKGPEVGISLSYDLTTLSQNHSLGMAARFGYTNHKSGHNTRSSLGHGGGIELSGDTSVANHAQSRFMTTAYYALSYNDGRPMDVQLRPALGLVRFRPVNDTGTPTDQQIGITYGATLAIQWSGNNQRNQTAHEVGIRIMRMPSWDGSAQSALSAMLSYGMVIREF